MSDDEDLTGIQNPINKIMNLGLLKNEKSSMNEGTSMNEESQKNESPIINSGNAMHVIFKYYGDRFYFSSHKDEFLSSLFYKFREQINDFKTDFNFQTNDIYRLDPKKKLGDVNKENHFIFYINANEIKTITGGGFCINFTDLSKQIYEEHYFSDKAPSYRVICKGMNIYGICKFKKCKAYNKEVIAPIEKIKFDLIKEKDILECPECEGIIFPKTVGFHLCEYKIKGTKFENGKGIPFDFNGKADNDDSVQYYNPDKNGQTTIVELIIEITKYL